MNIKKDISSAISKGYLINGELHDSISEEKLIIRDTIDNTINNSSMYVIVFRLLNVKSNTLVFNYIDYNYSFKNILFLFLLSRYEMMLQTYKEPGHFLSFINKSLFSNLQVTDNLSSSKGSTDNIIYLLDHFYISPHSDNYIYEALGVINLLTYTTDYSEMSILIKKAVNKDYKGFISNI